MLVSEDVYKSDNLVVSSMCPVVHHNYYPYLHFPIHNDGNETIVEFFDIDAMENGLKKDLDVDIGAVVKENIANDKSENLVAFVYTQSKQMHQKYYKFHASACSQDYQKYMNINCTCKKIQESFDVMDEHSQKDLRSTAYQVVSEGDEGIFSKTSNCTENQISPDTTEFYYQNIFDIKYPFLVVFLNAEQDAFIFKSYNGKCYSLKVNDIRTRFKKGLEKKGFISNSPLNVRDLWEIAAFSEIVLPIVEQFPDTFSTMDPHIVCKGYAKPLFLHELIHSIYNQDFTTFLLELYHYRSRKQIIPQIILFLNMLTRGSSKFITPTNMRYIYNMWKSLLKEHASQELIPYLVEYTKHCNQTIGLLGQAWIYMQAGEGKSRSNFKAFTLLHQITLNPNSFPKQAAFVYFSLGRLQRSNEEGINMYTKSIELDPRNTFTFNNRASRYKSFAPELSIQDYTAAISLDPSDPLLYYNRALMYKRCSQNIEASEDFSKVVELDSSIFHAFYFRAQINQMHLHDYNVALNDYTHVIERSSNKQLLVKAYFSRGSLYATHLNEPVLALYDFNRALELNPQYSNALYNRKHLLGKLCKLTCIGNL